MYLFRFSDKYNRLNHDLLFINQNSLLKRDTSVGLQCSAGWWQFRFKKGFTYHQSGSHFGQNFCNIVFLKIDEK